MRKFHKHIPIFAQSLIYIYSYSLFRPFCKFSVRGAEQIKDLPSGLIFAANHTSEWDGPLVRVGLPFFSHHSPMYYVSMVSQKYTGSGWRRHFYGGRLFEWLGAYPVYSGKKDYSYSLQNHIALLNLGKNVCIFPEGGRSFDGTIRPARGGVGYLAYRTKKRVVPVYIKGLINLNLKDFLLRKRHVEIIFGTPIDMQPFFTTDQPTVQDFHIAAEHIMSQVKSLV